MSNWPEVELGEIFDIARGGSPRPIDAFITSATSGVNWISISDATDSSKYINQTKKKIIKEGVARSRMVYPGDFLLTNSMSFGRPYIMNTTGCIHDGWLVLSKKKENVDQDYLYHLLGSETTYRKFKSLAAGAVVKNLNIDLVKSVKVPFPPLNEQKRIAAILDKADSLRRKRQQAIQLADDFLRAIFLKNYDSSSARHKKLKMLELAEPIKNSFVNGPFGSDLLTSELTETGIPVIYIRDIRERRYKRVSTVCVSKDKADDLDFCNVKPHDVLIAKVGDPPGTAAIYPHDREQGIVTQDVIRIRCNTEICCPEYLVAFINSYLGKNLLKPIIVEATRSRIGLGDLKKINIFMPPLQDQLEYLEFHKKTTALIDELIKCSKVDDEMNRALALMLG